MSRATTLILLALALGALGRVAAQEQPRPLAERQSWDVYLRRDPADEAAISLIFLNLLTGETQELATRGEDFSIVDNGVLYFERAEGQVKLAQPGREPRDHPFISLGAGADSIDWAVSADSSQIAWAISSKAADGRLTTAVHLADASGEPRELLRYGPRENLRLLPVAFSDDGGTLYLDVHPVDTGGLKPYPWHSGIFSLDLANGAIQTLPGESSCLCAVGFGSGLMLRLAPNPASGGIDVELHRLDGQPPQIIPSLPREGYLEAGAPLLNTAGSKAVYALSRVSAFRSPQQDIRTVFILVDLENGRQVALNSPLSALARPVTWTEDNSAILFITDTLDSSWKISLVDGSVAQVAAASYLGSLSNLESG